MRIVIQRVKSCSVTINNKMYSKINEGLLVLLGIEDGDDKQDIDWIVNKLLNLRICDDKDGVMNRSIQDTSGALMVVSQFTLFASTKKGNRPSYIRASKPEVAIPIYEQFIKRCEICLTESRVATGVFGADMQIELINDGPVTILIDSKNKE